jgi:prepilin-type N-terminal cleavage/methylation domain-containing protein
MSKINFKKGFGLVEIIVAVFVFSIVLGSLISASNMYISGAEENLKSTKGAYLAEEGIEAVKITRDANWANISALSNNTNYYLYFDTSSSTNNIWKATSTASLIDSIFTRTFKLEAVYRDSDGRITLSGGILDPNSKKVSVSISWPSKSTTTTKVLSTYIADIL